MTVDIGDGASCHVGYRSCFYRSIPLGPIDNGRKVEMKFTEKEKKFDPEKVYKGQPNPTKIQFMSLQILKPFGPSVMKVKIPEKILNDLNDYVDKIIEDKEKKN